MVRMSPLLGPVPVTVTVPVPIVPEVPVNVSVFELFWMVIVCPAVGPVLENVPVAWTPVCTEEAFAL